MVKSAFVPLGKQQKPVWQQVQELCAMMAPAFGDMVHANSSIENRQK